MKTKLPILIIIFIFGLSRFAEGQEMIITDDAGYTTAAAGAVSSLHTRTGEEKGWKG